MGHLSQDTLCDKYGNFHLHILAMLNKESVILFMRKTAMDEKSCLSQVSGIDFDSNLLPDE
ncbi:hypothetical protein O6P32_01745 [Phocaeicola sp. KGMB11183]|uniref:Uncharacterized protein n=1 Tax=Phocaeicola acetigenes TaxID=3016083 RepID=A0ABT4PEG0_9BACT|nr:hypothetical protein [Phocaeicola sp. KGMB11183]MCZ8371429.1 hypothetical protein [Phocaeicola sp. KGMB11183]